MPPGDAHFEYELSSAEPLLDNPEPTVSTPSLTTRSIIVSIAIIVFIVVATVVGSLRGSIKYGEGNQRLEYLRAVKCLSSIPSNVCNGTLHDEFAYIHREIGDYSHESAAFLPWHRYFLHIYERTLKDKCHFNGTLPYWDWTRDWMNLTRSPVWDAKEGFGGNGNLDLPTTVGHGRCVSNGPFANLQVQYYSNDWSPHCLSRGFLTGKLQDHFGAHRLNDSAIAAVIDESVYFDFLVKLEEGPHSAIPINVRGDFSRATAPNDPIFFLHHGQLDRLWWKWQSQNAGTRILAYDGPSRHGSSTAAKLTDLVGMGELAEKTSVRSVMDINDGIWCYRYQD